MIFKERCQKKCYFRMTGLLICSIFLCLVVFSVQANSQVIDINIYNQYEFYELSLGHTRGGLSLDNEAHSSALLGYRVYTKPSPYPNPDEPINIGKVNSLEGVKKLDWRSYNKKNWLTPIKDQRGKGVSWAFAPVAMVESRMKIWANDPKLDIDLSEQYLLSSCSTRPPSPLPPFISVSPPIRPNFDHRWKYLMGYAVWALNDMRGNGVPVESCMEYRFYNPYSSDPEPTCGISEHSLENTRFYRIQDWGFVGGDWKFESSEETVDAIKKELLNGPVCTYIDVCRHFLDWLQQPENYKKDRIWPDEEFEEAIKEIIVPSDFNTSLMAGMYVTIVGWDETEPDKKHWIVRNSHPGRMPVVDSMGNYSDGDFIGDYFKVRMGRNDLKIEEQVYFAIPLPYHKRVFTVKHPADIQEMIDVIYNDLGHYNMGSEKRFILGDEILVYKGIYSGGIDFKGMPITIRSKSGRNDTILDGSGDGPVVTFENGEGSNSVLNGFTIKNGSATQGGGIYCNNSSPTIIDCNIVDNEAKIANRAGLSVRTAQGGGVYCHLTEEILSDKVWLFGNLVCQNIDYSAYDGKYHFEACWPRFVNCKIGNNKAQKGGGIYFYSSIGVNLREPPYSSSPNLEDCKINDNSAESGGGVWCYGESYMDGCTIKNNDASSDTEGGGGIYFDGGSQLVVDCNIFENITDASGGGVFCKSDRQEFIKCVIARNEAQTGGGIYCNSISCVITNCTIVENEIEKFGGGIFADGTSIIYLTNSILWGNSSKDYDCMGWDEVSSPDLPVLRYAYSDMGSIGRGNIGLSMCDTINEHLASGQMDENLLERDPLFWCPEGDDYSLQSDSPCIDKGSFTDTFVYEAMLDLYQNKNLNKVIVSIDTKEKSKDGDDDGEIRWDMGADEFGESDDSTSDPVLCKPVSCVPVDCKPVPCVSTQIYSPYESYFPQTYAPSYFPQTYAPAFRVPSLGPVFFPNTPLLLPYGINPYGGSLWPFF